MKLQIISRETIKPSSPIPHSQIWYKPSVFNQMSYGVYIPIIQFYTSNGGDNLVDFSHRLSRLKKSLSETLTRYYALAGRIGDGGSIVFPDRSFWGWILSTKFYISFPLRYKQKISFIFSCFSLVLRNRPCVWFKLKTQLIYRFFLLCQKYKPKFFFPTTQEKAVQENHNTKMLKQSI